MEQTVSLIRELLDMLAVEFVPEQYLRARRLISHADEDGADCEQCGSGKSVGRCGLCFPCANGALSAGSEARAPHHTLP